MSTMLHHKSPTEPHQPMLFTIPEAAWVAGIAPCAVQNDIKKKVVVSSNPHTRLLDRCDVSYFRSIRGFQNDLTVDARKRLHLAIKAALLNNIAVKSISFGDFRLCLTTIIEDVYKKAADIIEARELVGRNEGVRGNNLVIRGTRIPVRMLAEIYRSGSSLSELSLEYSLTERQVEMAILFDKLHPPVGRPAMRQNDQWSDIGNVDRLDIEELGELRRS